jgi:hypothetical protein
VQHQIDPVARGGRIWTPIRRTLLAALRQLHLRVLPAVNLPARPAQRQRERSCAMCTDASPWIRILDESAFERQTGRDR